MLRDTDRAYLLLPDGEYVRARPVDAELPRNAQQTLLEHYSQDEL